MVRPTPGHRPYRGGQLIPRRNPPTDAEARAWAEVLVHRRHLYAAVAAPNGQWLVQPAPAAPVRVLDGPAAVLDLTAQIQRRIRTPKARGR